MKSNSFHNKTTALCMALALLAVSCNKKLDALSPHNVLFEDAQFSTSAGFASATLGNYYYFSFYYSPANLFTEYEATWFNISEFRGNNVKVIDVTSTSPGSSAQDIDAFNYTNSTSKDYGLSDGFWKTSYQALLGINKVLSHVPENTTDSIILQAKAENLFLRATAYFNLVRVYGKPYYQSPETNLGLPLILTPIASDPPGRGTVKETYDQIIADLTNAITAFRSASSANPANKKVNSFASKYAAYALLSRVYLYMSGTFASPNAANAKLAAQYADSVILNGGYTLLTGSAYSAYYNITNQTNAESVWAINNTANNNVLPRLLNQPIASLAGSYSTGQIKPSPDFLSLLTTGDLRKSFYAVEKYPGNTTDTFSCIKYNTISYSGVYYSRNAVHYLRLAEIYLNRAEAKLKNGDNTGALADLNVIHTRAGLTALSGLSGQSLFDAIMLERRLELAFEGHNSYDYFRNGLPMVRNYASFNSPAMTVAATDAKVVMRISQDILTENGKIVQNAQ